ncbi:MAG: hypothetical protein KKB50_03340 [Planctomycetes bacterium]|nr:hypothetical protein [Planctomycetota bacterium]
MQQRVITFSLQSGSNGNAVYVEPKGVRLLFDAGPQHGNPRAWFALLDYHLTHVAGRPARLAAHLGALLTSHDR